MKYLIPLLGLLFALCVPASALEIQPPPVPEAGEDWMPEETESFGAGLWELATKALGNLRPDLRQAAQVSLGVIATVLLVSVLESMSNSLRIAGRIAGTGAVAGALLLSSNSMLALGIRTVTQISEYGKLLLGVMAAALGAQGGITSSTALYAGTALFNGLLTSLITGWLVPGISLFLALGVGAAATGEAMLKNLGDLLKRLMSWVLKLLLMVFTTYLSITGVVSGTTDAAALKAAKVTISSFVPVVGGILADASEAVLVSAGMMKNAAGIYGILAVLAIFLHPFLQIGVHYLILKVTSALCEVFGSRQMAALTDCFSTAMGFLLAMTGGCCVMVLVSTVCFLKGVG